MFWRQVFTPSDLFGDRFNQSWQDRYATGLFIPGNLFYLYQSISTGHNDLKWSETELLSLRYINCFEEIDFCYSDEPTAEKTVASKYPIWIEWTTPCSFLTNNNIYWYTGYQVKIGGDFLRINTQQREEIRNKSQAVKPLSYKALNYETEPDAFKLFKK